MAGPKKSPRRVTPARASRHGGKALAGGAIFISGAGVLQTKTPPTLLGMDGVNEAGVLTSATWPTPDY
jgi:hypothetical protein